MEDLPNEFLRANRAADLLKIGLEDFRDPQRSHGRQLALGAHQLPSVAFGSSHGVWEKVKTAGEVPSIPTAREMTARWPMCTPSNTPRAMARGVRGMLPMSCINR